LLTQPCEHLRDGRTFPDLAVLRGLIPRFEAAQNGNCRCDTRSHTMSEHTEEVDTMSSV
jgi:hypothetical protein